MALSYANVNRVIRDNIDIVYAEITGDSAYLPGGETVNASDFGFSQIKGLIVMSATSGWRGMYKRTNDQSGTLQVWATATTTESSGTPVDASVRDLSSITFYCLVIGK